MGTDAITMLEFQFTVIRVVIALVIVVLGWYYYTFGRLWPGPEAVVEKDSARPKQKLDTAPTPKPVSKDSAQKASTASHKPLDYSKWDRVDWDKPEPAVNNAVQKRTTAVPAETGERGKLLNILRNLVPQVLAPFAVKKLDSDGRGFLILKCSHKVDDYDAPPPHPTLQRKFSARYISDENTSHFLQRMGASAVEDTVTKYVEDYDPRKELVVAVCTPTETGKGTHVSSMRLSLVPSFEECSKHPPFTMDVLQIDYDKVEKDERPNPKPAVGAS